MFLCSMSISVSVCIKCFWKINKLLFLVNQLKVLQSIDFYQKKTYMTFMKGAAIGDELKKTAVSLTIMELCSIFKLFVLIFLKNFKAWVPSRGSA